MKKIVTIYLLTILAVINLIAQDELSLLTTVHGEKEGDAFSKVATLGDVNGDGFDDFIVGSNPRGYAKLYFGGSPFDTNNYIRFESSASFTAYKGSFAGRGDLNGDGFADFVLGANYDIFQFGKVFIHFGGTEIDTTADLTITGQGYYYLFGSSISIDGDLNGDGYDDLVVSAPMDDYDARGRVYIYFGGSDMDTECDVYLEGEEAFDAFGGSIDIVNDVNGDGYYDLLVGAPQTLADDKPGKAYLFFGGNEIGFENSIEFIGDETTYDYGRFLSDLGDINGDEFRDWGIASGKYIDVYSGQLQNKLFTIISEENYWYPWNISNGYDLNDDGYSDFIISFAHQENQYAGGIAIYLGGDEVDTTASFILDGTTKNSYFGKWLSIGGDINDDDTPEVFIGEEGELTQSGTLGPGCVYIYSYKKLSGVENRYETKLPTDYDIKQNYPNPFNSQTRISYIITEGSNVELTIYDITGKRIKNLFTGYQPPGSYEINWDGLDEDNSIVSSGVYFLKLSAKSFSGNSQLQQKIIKMVLMK